MPGTFRNMLLPWQEKVERRLTRYKKQIKFAFRHLNGNALPIFVMGYGRSGTTMMLNTFALDGRFNIYRENDTRISRNYMLDYQKVGHQISSCKAEALVMKPILNSFDAGKILQMYARAKIVWMIRDYRDVVASAIVRFGSRVADYLNEEVKVGGGDNWLASGLSKESLQILREMDVNDFTDYDWMALVWWSVNRTVLVEKLYDSSHFFLLRYEDLVRNPDQVLVKLFKFLELNHERRLGKYIHGMSVGKGSHIRLHRAVQEMCDSLTEEITGCCKRISRVENSS